MYLLTEPWVAWLEEDIFPLVGSGGTWYNILENGRACT
jgi:hypothetical protein